MKESFDKQREKKPQNLELKFTITNSFSRCFFSFFSLLSTNLTTYYKIHWELLASYFYFCFNLIFYFNITIFTALSNVSKGLARYQSNCLTNLIVTMLVTWTTQKTLKK